MGVSPAQLVYGQDLQLPVDVLLRIWHVGRVPAADKHLYLGVATAC